MLDRRRFLVTSFGAASAVVLGGCTQADQATEPTATATRTGPTATATRTPTPTATPTPVQRITLRLAGDDSGLPSPFTYSRGGGYIQMSYLYDTLLWKDSTGELLPWLAAGFTESEGGTVYTFELREGVLWHDGMPLTAEDVAFTFDYYKQQQLSPQVIAPPVPDISEVVALDERTVEFRLTNPVATFLQFGGAGAVPIVPRHIWESVDNAAMASDPALLIGSGPFRLESYTPGEGAYLYVANDDYFQGPPLVERIENAPVGDELQALLAGELDQAGGSGLRPDVLAPFESDDRLAVMEAPPGSSTLSLYWNIALGGALADPQFRKACALAIDREDMVERLFGGNGVPGNPGWIPPENPFHTDVEQYTFDPDTANAMLDEAGYTRSDPGADRQTPDGQPLSFTLAVIGPPPPAAELVVQALQAVGVGVELQPLDRPTFNERVIAGETELSLIGSGGMNSDLAPDYLRLVYNSTTELTQHAQGYVNERVDELTQEQLRTLDTEERMAIVAEIQELIADDLPLLPLFYPSSFTIVDTTVLDGWYFTPGGVAGVVPTLNNKQLFIVGQPTGLGPEVAE